MGKFNDQPTLKRIDAKTWETTAILIYVLDEDVASWAYFKEVVVPVGFKTDGASIPRLPLTRWIIGTPLVGEYVRAALIHDYLYAVQTVNKGLADRIFERAMKDDGVSWWRRNLIYQAVSMFGGFAWAENGKEIVKDDETFKFNRGVIPDRRSGWLQRKGDKEDGGACRNVRSSDRELSDEP